MPTVRTQRELGAAVRDARLTSGLTQAQLAERVGLARQWVVQLEAGRTNPTWENVRAVCEALDLTLSLSTSRRLAEPASDTTDAPAAALPQARTPKLPFQQPDYVDLDELTDKHTLRPGPA